MSTRPGSLTRWQAFTAVCVYLRAGLLDGARPPRLPGISWELLIEASSHHLVIPALAWCLQSDPQVPSEVSDYLGVILAANAERNAKLLGGLTRVVQALNDIDIAPVLLKGAARLIDGSYPTPALRFLRDLDVLVPAERSAEAAAALQAIGFRENPDFEPMSPNHHHLSVLCDNQAGVGVELHTALVPPDCPALMPIDWFYQGTDPHLFGDLQVRLPSATRSVGHIIAHDQLGHDNYWRGRLILQQLLDLAVIRKNHENSIDWTELDHRFSGTASGKVLATYLEFANKLLGQARPQLRHAARVGALAELRWGIEPSGWTPWARVSLKAFEYIANQGRDRHGALTVPRMERIVSLLKPHEPSW